MVLSRPHFSTSGSLIWGAQNWTEGSKCVSPGLSRGEGSSSSVRPNEAQEAVGLRCKGTSLTHNQLGVHWHPMVLSCSSWLVPSLYGGIGLLFSGRKNFACPFLELQTVPASPFHQPVAVPLDGSTSIQCMYHFPWFYMNKFAEGAFCPIVQVTNEDVKQYLPHCHSLVYTSDWLPAAFCTTSHLCSSSPHGPPPVMTNFQR